MFTVLDAYKVNVSNPEKLKPIHKMNDSYEVCIVEDGVKIEKQLLKNIVYIEILSVSPEGEYKIVYCHNIFKDEDRILTDRYHYYLVKENDSEICIIDNFEDPDDVCIQWFTNGFEWYPEYGFVKMIVKNVDTWEHRNKRIYYDRNLYEKKKSERSSI